MTTNEDVVSAGAQVGTSVAAAAAAAAAAQPEKHARYSVTGIVGKGTFGRVFKTRRTDTNIFVPEAKMARSLVLKHSMVIPTAVLRARPQLGSISGLPFDDAENADEEEAACSEEGEEGFACRRLRGIIARNREARVLNDLTQPVDPMTPIRVDAEGVVHIGEEAAPPDAAKAEAVPFSLVPRLYDSFFAYECASVRPPAVADKVPASAATSAANDSILMVTVSESFGVDLSAAALRHTNVLASDAILRDIIRQSFMLLDRLHSRGYVHRDIKPHNMLIDFLPSGHPMVRMCDVGATRKMRPVDRRPVLDALRAAGVDDPAPFTPGETTAPARSTPLMVARYYRAPELLCGSTVYGTPIDVWSIAVSLLEVYWLVASLCNSAASARLSLQRGSGLALTGQRGEDAPSRTRCTLFHGSTSDGAQLAHIINLLGLPTKEDIEGMNIELECSARLMGLMRLVSGLAETEARPHLTTTATSSATPKAAPLHVATGFMCATAPVQPDALSRSAGALAPQTAAEAAPVAPAFPKLASLDLQRFLEERYIPVDLAHLFAQLLQWDPRRRLTAAEALRHPALTRGAFVPERDGPAAAAREAHA